MDPLRSAGPEPSGSSDGDGSSPDLVRGLGLFDSIFIVMGIIIGSGIFLTTGVMADSLPSPALLMGAWAVGGLLTLAGALTFAELGAAMPEAGGQYIYLREAYGPLVAFLFGWITFLVYQPGAIAAVAVGFAVYLGYFVPAFGTETVLIATEFAGYSVSLSAGQLVAVGLIVFLTHMNVVGLRIGSLIQNVSTVLKVAAIGAFIALGFVLGKGGSAEVPSIVGESGETSLLTGFGVALVAVLWSYDGWSNLNFSAGEIKNPGRTLPQALFLGTIGVTVVYLLTNAVYLHALSIEEMRGVIRVADRAAEALFGPAGTSFIVAAILVSTFGSTNGTVLTGARVYYAMAKDGLFFEGAGRVHEKYHTPHLALWVQALWASLLALSGTFEQLFTYAMFAAVMMYGAATASVFTLRRKRPDLPRPYRVWGYPVVPALYLLALGAIVLNTLVERPLESIAGLGILAVGIPVYFYWRRDADIEPVTTAADIEGGRPR